MYGAGGLGKTHLLHAIGNNINKNNTGQNVIFAPTKEFFSDVQKALDLGKKKDFEKLFKSVNVLLLDDFQDIPQRNDSQKLFYKILSNFLNNKKQIVITGDRPINKIDKLHKNLVKKLKPGGKVSIINLTESGIEIVDNMSNR
jgi:chromosomal replication initiator protein